MNLKSRNGPELLHDNNQFLGPDVSRPDTSATVELSVVMPCLNESRTLGSCVKKARDTIERLGIDGEVIVADNGSTDGSQSIAEELGARVVPIAARGYGSALRGGIAAARGKFVVMGDSDESYDFAQLGDFVRKLREGDDLVMGNRFRGGIRPDAMPFLHRFLGNPFLSWLGRLFFGCPVGDFLAAWRDSCNSIRESSPIASGSGWSSVSNRPSRIASPVSSPRVTSAPAAAE